MSVQGAAANPELASGGATRAGDSSRDHGHGRASHSAEADVLRNSLSAVMVEYHEQTKKLASMAADHARQSQEIAAMAARHAAGEAERDALRAECRELEKRLSDIQSSTLWVATRRLREVFTRHPRLRRLITKIRRALARP